MAETSSGEFDPSRFLTKVGGNDYLEVKWRLFWLRSVHPDASIDTDCISFTDTMAVFKATVTLPNGASATGWGTESINDFRDYIEKAESKSLGRALAALGFGTQFAIDLDTAEVGRIVDAPVDRQRLQQRRAQATTGSRPDGSDQGATPRQQEFIAAMVRDLGISDGDLDRECQQMFGRGIAALTRADASALIERLRQRRGAQSAGAAR